MALAPAGIGPRCAMRDLHAPTPHFYQPLIPLIGLPHAGQGPCFLGPTYLQYMYLITTQKLGIFSRQLHQEQPSNR